MKTAKDITKETVDLAILGRETLETAIELAILDYARAQLEKAAKMSEARVEHCFYLSNKEIAKRIRQLSKELS